MQVSFRIICADPDISRVEKHLNEIPSAHAKIKIMPYWKILGCTEITFEYYDVRVDTAYLQEKVRQIGGNDELIISQQGDCEEYSIYTSSEKIASSGACAFVVCFVNMKESTL